MKKILYFIVIILFSRCIGREQVSINLSNRCVNDSIYVCYEFTNNTSDSLFLIPINNNPIYALFEDYSFVVDENFVEDFSRKKIIDFRQKLINIDFININFPITSVKDRFVYNSQDTIDIAEMFHMSFDYYQNVGTEFSIIEPQKEMLNHDSIFACVLKDFSLENECFEDFILKAFSLDDTSFYDSDRWLDKDLIDIVKKNFNDSNYRHLFQYCVFLPPNSAKTVEVDFSFLRLTHCNYKIQYNGSPFELWSPLVEYVDSSFASIGVSRYRGVLKSNVLEISTK